MFVYTRKCECACVRVCALSIVTWKIVTCISCELNVFVYTLKCVCACVCIINRNTEDCNLCQV